MNENMKLRCEIHFANHTAIVCGCGDPAFNLTTRYQTYTKGPGPFRFNSTILVNCIGNYTFDDLTKTKNMTCLFTGEWNYLPSCNGMQHVLKFPQSFAILRKHVMCSQYSYKTLTAKYSETLY